MEKQYEKDTLKMLERMPLFINDEYDPYNVLGMNETVFTSRAE
jgi:hypothetical protein